MAPSLMPNRTGVRICAPFWIDGIFLNHRIFLNHHSRLLYNDRPANHDRLGDYGGPLLDNDAWLGPVLVRLNCPRVNFPCANFPLVARNFGITSHGEIRGHCRGGKN